MISHLYKSGTRARLDENCISTAQYKLAYTGVEPLDEGLCGLVTVFHASMDPSNIAFTIEGLTSLATYVTLPYIEAARSGRNLALAFPVLFGILYQSLSMAFIFPLYCLAFVWSGAASFHKHPHTRDSQNLTKVDQAHAEGILFGLFVGYLIPTASMLVLEDPYVTIIWQFFPIWMTVSQFAHLFFRPSSRYPYSGYPTVRATYIILFIVSTSYHIGIVWPRLRDGALLNHLFLPGSIHTHNPATTTLEVGVLELFKRDVAIGFGSVALVTLWLARSIKELVLLVAWHIAATVIVGPGAALAAALLWREALLNGHQPKEADSKREVKSE